jgi:hypothetical protein
MEFKQQLLKNIGVIAAIILFLILFIVFLGNDISNRIQKIGEQKQAFAGRSQSIESFVSLRADALQAEKLSEKLQNALPTKDQLIGFSKVLEKMAKNNKLAFGFSFGNEISSAETAPGINEFTLTSGGVYANFIRFLKAVEESGYFVRFDFFDIAAKKGEEFEILAKGKVFSQ